MDYLHHIRYLMPTVRKIRRGHGVWNFECEQMPKHESQRFLRFQNESAEPLKKGPGGCLKAATEADQPGMGMTNRVIPAQGEERGASFTLNTRMRETA